MRLRRLLGFALLVIFALAPAASFAQFNQVPLISTSLGGIISGTNVYAKNISASSLTVGSCTGCGSSVSGTTAAIKPGWPDILVCNVTNPNWGIRYLYLGADTGSVVEYHDFINSAFINYNSDKTFNSYSYFTTTNCATSVTTLVSQGQGIFLNTSQWVVSGSTIYNTPFNVGIGTTNPTAKLEVNGTISATNFVGNGSGLTGISGGGSSDRITSGTTGMVAQTASGIISITTSNVNTGYFNANGVLTAPGISATANLTSVTTLYASGKVGVKTATPTVSFDVSGSIRLSTDGAACGSTIKGALQYTNQTLQVCDGVSWTSVASFPGAVPTTPGSGGIGYMVMTSATFTGNLGGLSGANAKCYSDLNTYSWKNKPGSLDSSKVKAFLCDKTSCNAAVANVTYYFANAGDATLGGAFFTTTSGGLGPGDNYQWDGSNRFGIASNYWVNRAYGTGGNYWDNSLSDTSNAATCTGFTSSSSSSTGSFGNAGDTTDGRWKHDSNDCSNTFKLLCFVHP